MPKPMAYRPGSGLHINISLRKGGAPVLAGEGRGGLSAVGSAFLAGILDHARALTALLNPTANSFKRLDALSNAMAPVCYGIGNRTAPVRLPAAGHRLTRIEVRFGDAAANPYLAFAAVILAGLDGVERGLDPGEPYEGNCLRDGAWFDPRRRSPGSLCRSLEEAVVALDGDCEFLRKGGAFTSSLLSAHLEELCRQIRVGRSLPHPNEFLMSYSV
jgi:glutamine synthetase